MRIVLFRRLYDRFHYVCFRLLCICCYGCARGLVEVDCDGLGMKPLWTLTVTMCSRSARVSLQPALYKQLFSHFIEHIRLGKLCNDPLNQATMTYKECGLSGR